MNYVIKVGSSSLFDGRPLIGVFDSITVQTAQLMAAGHQVTIVNSGAIAFGRRRPKKNIAVH